jgi:hypothetical protein
MTRSTRSSEPHRSRFAASVQDGGKASRAARNQQRRSKSSSRRKVHHPTGDGLAVDEATVFSGVIGVTGCDPPVDFGPGVTPALLSVETFELLVAFVSVFGLAPFVGPVPASSVDVGQSLKTQLRDLIEAAHLETTDAARH